MEIVIITKCLICSRRRAAGSLSYPRLTRETRMKRNLCSLIATLTIAAFCVVLLAAAPQPNDNDKEKNPKPQYDAKGQLLRPADYRDWMFLSAGYGMNYSPSPGSHEMFTNVFVQRWAYDEFLKSGKWPEQTAFVIDERDAQSKGSINKTGHFQTDLMGLAVEGEESAHHPDKWAYYGFDAHGQTAEAMPHGNGCFACHDAHAAVEP